MAWRGPEVDPLDPISIVSAKPGRREHLDVDLAAARLTSEDRARVAFVVDYVWWFNPRSLERGRRAAGTLRAR
ncbi:hypothetical protein [Nocardia asiatica]|uniref:hypothetical protein n=1 Tax=Nocardia asiatica TaxID=209252 RepID=UPI00245547FD|nr:hypothetical protein [Nocardia asiatica]